MKPRKETVNRDNSNSFHSNSSYERGWELWIGGKIFRTILFFQKWTIKELRPKKVLSYILTFRIRTFSQTNTTINKLINKYTVYYLLFDHLDSSLALCGIYTLKSRPLSRCLYPTDSDWYLDSRGSTNPDNLPYWEIVPYSSVTSYYFWFDVRTIRPFIILWRNAGS